MTIWFDSSDDFLQVPWRVAMELETMKAKDAMLALAKRWRDLASGREPSVRDTKIACAEEIERYFAPKRRRRAV